jgi:hypothetical protein
MRLIFALPAELARVRNGSQISVPFPKNRKFMLNRLHLARRLRLPKRLR